MKRIICAVFDSAAGCYGQPMFVPARGAAVRAFTDEINRAAQDNALYQHPEDFAMFEVGTFDDEEGVIEGGKPELIVRGQDCRRS